MLVNSAACQSTTWQRTSNPAGIELKWLPATRSLRFCGKVAEMESHSLRATGKWCGTSPGETWENVCSPQFESQELTEVAVLPKFSLINQWVHWGCLQEYKREVSYKNLGKLITAEPPKSSPQGGWRWESSCSRTLAYLKEAQLEGNPSHCLLLV